MPKKEIPQENTTCNIATYIPAVIAPTVEFKSSRQLRCEKRQRKKDSCSEYSFKLYVPSLERNTCMAAPPVQVTSPNSSADEAEPDYYSDGDHSSTPSSYVQACIREMSDSNILTTVLRKCEDHGLTRHFMCLIKQIVSGNLPVTNMAFFAIFGSCAIAFIEKFHSDVLS